MTDRLATRLVLIVAAVLVLGAWLFFARAFGDEPERACARLPAAVVEETPRRIIDAWYSAERCTDMTAPRCGE